MSGKTSDGFYRGCDGKETLLDWGKYKDSEAARRQAKKSRQMPGLIKLAFQPTA
ncbi:hypothetical protein [Undibacterium sp.]|uniref:hypothetical protein n=1 Tax=Undibacterium sp. TaxID=1914977 RepID=UPI00374D5225